eukprot:SAG31_NODE_18611_length_629_cov_1.339623_2_plen_70_part_01
MGPSKLAPGAGRALTHPAGRLHGGLTLPGTVVPICPGYTFAGGSYGCIVSDCTDPQKFSLCCAEPGGHLR